MFICLFRSRCVLLLITCFRGGFNITSIQESIKDQSQPITRTLSPAITRPLVAAHSPPPTPSLVPPRPTIEYEHQPITRPCTTTTHTHTRLRGDLMRDLTYRSQAPRHACIVAEVCSRDHVVSLGLVRALGVSWRGGQFCYTLRGGGEGWYGKAGLGLN